MLSNLTISILPVKCQLTSLEVCALGSSILLLSHHTMSLPLEVILHVLSSESLSFFLPSRSAESKVESGSGGWSQSFSSLPVGGGKGRPGESFCAALMTLRKNKAAFRSSTLKWNFYCLFKLNSSCVIQSWTVVMLPEINFHWKHFRILSFSLLVL